MLNKFKFKVGISFFVIYFVWGSTFLATRITVESIPPFFSITLRFLMAGSLLAIWFCFKGRNQVSRRQVFNASLIGVLMIGVGSGPVAWALQYMPSGVTAMFIAIIPIWFIIFEKILVGSVQIKKSAWIGILISLIGIGLLSGFFDTDSINKTPLIPFLMILLACISCAFASILGRRLDKPNSNLMDVTIQMISGGLFSLIIGLIIGEHHQLKTFPVTLVSLLAIFYLATFGSVVVYSAYNFLIKNVNSGLVSTHCYINPIVAVILGWFLLAEPLNIRIVLACCLILIGVAFIRKGYQPAEDVKISKSIHSVLNS
jgi:drug/metabolite transporter (DMT)-like permease